MFLQSAHPVTDFADGFPIGNGRLGVMCFGGPARLVFVINHCDFWHRPPSYAQPKSGFWKSVRERTVAGDWAPVGKMIHHAFDEWENSDEGSFQVGAFIEVWLQLKALTVEEFRDWRNKWRTQSMSDGLLFGKARRSRSGFAEAVQTIE